MYHIVASIYHFTAPGFYSHYIPLNIPISESCIPSSPLRIIAIFHHHPHPTHVYLVGHVGGVAAYAVEAWNSHLSTGLAVESGICGHENIVSIPEAIFLAW